MPTPVSHGRFEQDLQDTNVKLDDAGQARERFLASVRHELRTPVNAILGFTGTLLMGLPGPLNASETKQLRTVEASSRHLLSLIDGLLDPARIEAGKLELNIDSSSPIREASNSRRSDTRKTGPP